MNITRRAFIRFAAAMLAYAAQPASRIFAATSGEGELDTDAVWQRGRAQFSLPVRVAPSYDAAVIKWIAPDSSFTILGAVLGDRPLSHNNVWYLIPGGYVHSAWVQPMAIYRPQPVETKLPEWGIWGEIFKPYTSARTAPYDGAEEKYRLYYGTVFHIIDVLSDPANGSWYQIYDELPPTATYWVKAHHIRKLTPWELRPVNPNKPLSEKLISVDLKAQTVICYEGEQPVYFTRCASGASFQYADGQVQDFTTPTGEFNVLLKQPSRHMIGGTQGEDDFFDLPGVPWNTFFTYSGIAIHGTFWHNDYGVQRSHGCVNVSPEAAKWIYRWSFPVAPYEDDYVQSDSKVGTRIVVA